MDVSDTSQSASGSLDSITVTNFFASIPVPIVVTSASAAAFAVGLTGATNSAFLVDASTALQVAGLKVTGAVTGGTVAIVATDSGSNTNLTVNAKGSGTIGIGSVSTGRVTITPVTTITGSLTLSAALIYGGVTLSNAVTGTGNMVLSASPTLTGTITVTGATITGLTAASVGAGTFPAGAFVFAGGVSGITSLAIGGALSGVTTLAGSGVATFTATGASVKLTPGSSALTYLTVNNNSAAERASFGWNPSGDVGFIGNQQVSVMTWSGNSATPAIVFSSSAVSGITTLAIGGALSGVTTLATSSTINSQTISATANFTGTVTIATGLTVSAGTTAVQALTATTISGTTLTATNSTLVFTATGVSTNGRWIRLTNTSGDAFFGTESSAGGSILTGATAYATVISSLVNKPVQIGSNDTLIATFATTGITSTVGISATTGAFSGAVTGASFKTTTVSVGAVANGAQGTIFNFSGLTGTWLVTTYTTAGSGSVIATGVVVSDPNQVGGFTTTNLDSGSSTFNFSSTTLQILNNSGASSTITANIIKIG